MSRKKQFTSLVDVLTYQAKKHPEKTAYIFLRNGEKEEIRLTYRELDMQARCVAVHIQAQCRPGDRAMLIYPPGIEFIPAFFGCLYAGVMAVPVYPPNPANLHISMEKIMMLISDAAPNVIITTEEVSNSLHFIIKDYPELKKIKWLSTDNLNADSTGSLRKLQINENTLAFLQYTSGSTGNPKGVMVSHGNILYNQEMIKAGFGHSEQSVVVGWLPLFHDMGLIGNVLQPLYLGIVCILMSPVDFLKKPFRWLDAISRYNATTSGGPNFGYDLCVRKIGDEQLTGLDLSSWKVAFNGAEPVRARTLKRFSEKFKACGFKEKSFYPCYGMAEATLFISGKQPDLKPNIYNLDGASIEKDRINIKIGSDSSTQQIVGCGETRLDQKICIVNPESETLCADDKVGEIWVSGDNIAKGYWQNTKETRATFQAYIKDTGEGPFLRTGDLGFKVKKELFITGRAKDLIIINGRNVYPQDIENTVCQIHSSFRPGCGAAFSIEQENEEKLIIVQEVKNKDSAQLETDEIIAEIRSAIARHHDIHVHDVVLIHQGTLSKTSSGKVQRRQCRMMYMENQLDTVAVSICKPLESDITTNISPPDFDSVESIEDWLALRVSRMSSIDSESIEFSSSIFDYGLSSKHIMSLNGEVEEILGQEVSPTIFVDNPTISSIADTLAKEFLGKKYKA